MLEPLDSIHFQSFSSKLPDVLIILFNFYLLTMYKDRLSKNYFMIESTVKDLFKFSH